MPNVGLNLTPQDQESQALPTGPARHPKLKAEKPQTLGNKQKGTKHHYGFMGHKDPNLTGIYAWICIHMEYSLDKPRFKVNTSLMLDSTYFTNKIIRQVPGT